MELQQSLGPSYLLIAHDHSGSHISDIIAVMYLGKIVEMGPTGKIFDKPVHSYTKALLSAIPFPDPSIKRKNYHSRNSIAH